MIPYSVSLSVNDCTFEEGKRKEVHTGSRRNSHPIPFFRVNEKHIYASYISLASQMRFSTVILNPECFGRFPYYQKGAYPHHLIGNESAYQTYAVVTYSSCLLLFHTLDILFQF